MFLVSVIGKDGEPQRTQLVLNTDDLADVFATLEKMARNNSTVNLHGVIIQRVETDPTMLLLVIDE